MAWQLWLQLWSPMSGLALLALFAVATGVNCPDLTWISWGEGCYKLINEQFGRTHSQARTHCRELHDFGGLLWLDSLEEKAWVRVYNWDLKKQRDKCKDCDTLLEAAWTSLYREAQVPFAFYWEPGTAPPKKDTLLTQADWFWHSGHPKPPDQKMFRSSITQASNTSEYLYRSNFGTEKMWHICKIRDPITTWAPSTYSETKKITAESTTTQGTTTQPTITDTKTTVLTTTQSATAQPTTTQSATAQPITTQLATTQSTTTQSATAQPITTQSATAQPTTTQSATAQPTTTQSATAQPTTTQSATAQPTTAQPTTTQSATAQPTTTQPTTTQSTTTQSTSTQPTTTQPTTTQSATALPTTTKPLTAQPTTTQPITTQSTTTVTTTSDSQRTETANWLSSTSQSSGSPLTTTSATPGLTAPPVVSENWFKSLVSMWLIVSCVIAAVVLIFAFGAAIWLRGLPRIRLNFTFNGARVSPDPLTTPPYAAQQPSGAGQLSGTQANANANANADVILME